MLASGPAEIPLWYKYRAPSCSISLSGFLTTHAGEASCSIFPIGCLEVVFQAFSCLPANKVYNREALLHLTFNSGLSPAIFGQREGHRDSEAFRDTLSRVLISPLGSFIAKTNVRGFEPAAHDGQCLGGVTAWFVGQVKLRHAEGAPAALHRALKLLIEAWEDGKRVITATGDPRQALGHFYHMKQINCLIIWNTNWRQLISGGLYDCLVKAFSWACFRIAHSPIANEASHMQATVMSGAQVDVFEAIWSTAILNVWVVLVRPWSMTTPHRDWEWPTRLYFWRAGLGFIVGSPMWRNARDLAFATFFLAPICLYNDAQHIKDNTGVIQWVLEFPWDRGKVSSPVQADIDRMTGAVDDDAYWQRFWTRMRRGRRHVERRKDRQAYLDKWRQAKKLLEAQHGKAGNCDVDFSALL